MAADPRIAALFDLPTASSQLCDEESCEFLVKFLSHFYEYVNERKSCHPWVSDTELDALGNSLKALQATAPHKKIDWMPAYGCALVKSEAGCTSGVIALNLISLDLHQFQTTSKLSSNIYSYVDNAVSANYEVLFIGTCAVDKVKDVRVKFRSLLASRGTKKGEQRTPAFIHALYREAFGYPINQTPRGGMTDVGLHAGDQSRRNTAPPLVFFVLLQIFHNYQADHDLPISVDALFKKTIVYFGLYLSEVTLSQWRQEKVTAGLKTNAPHILLESALSILRSTSIKAAAFSDDGLDMSHFVDWSKTIHGEISGGASSQSALYSLQYELPRDEVEARGHFKDFTFELPAAYRPTKDYALSESEISENTFQNLGWVPVLDGRCLQDVNMWIKKSISITSQNLLSSMLVLKTIENIMWGFAKNMPALKLDELKALASMVDNYRQVLYDLRVKQLYGPLSVVQLKSREFLVVWVAYCVIHSNAVLQHSTQFEGYGVPLDFEDLSHLVLSNPTEWEVVLLVTKYLGKYGTNKPIFSLKDEISTFNMGRRIANASSDMVIIWNQEVKDASCRVEAHWNEVLRKQELVKKLRCEISPTEAEIAAVNLKLANARAIHGMNVPAKMISFLIYGSEDYLSEKLRSLQSELSSKESELKNALRPPLPVLQPLPKEKSTAMPIIFFLYMPPLFQLLSRFSFTAQQLRIPQPWRAAWGGDEGSQKFDLTKQVTRGAEACQYSWTDYYNTHQHSEYHSPAQSRNGSDYHLFLRSEENIVPSTRMVCLSTVDNYKSRNDGIWYPDLLKPRVAWFGGPNSFDKAPSGCEINPFANLDHRCIVSNFTERLTADCTLQWALIQPGDEYILPTRANLPYARLNRKPNWLSKTQYLAFGNLRSYPNTQLKNILLAIQERQLPFTEDIVHTLISQTLFHIGKISHISGCPILDWKRDLEDPDFGRDIHLIMNNFYDELKDAPKRYTSVKLIGRLCNFFSKWEPRCRSTARKLARSVCQWSKDLDGEIEKLPPSSAPTIRAKQVVLYQHSIMTLSSGVLDEADVALLIKLIVIVNANNPFTEDSRSDEIRTNATEIKYILCEQLEDILQAARFAPKMMTEALRSVFQRCPKSLNWKQWAPAILGHIQTQCFQAKGEDGHFYAINVVTGEVLIDGFPPFRMPQSILGHPLYKKSFGDRNFEVVRKGNFLETSYSVYGRFYKFYHKGMRLNIYEFKEDGSEMLELLDGTAPGKWSRDLPERLRRMHSHWLARSDNRIVLRGIRVRDRTISFLIKLYTKNGSIQGKVKCVEIHCKERQNLSYLMQNDNKMDSLVLHQQSKALDIIAKFEPKKYIHSMIDSKCELRFFCPRYQLTFDLLQGVLHCREIAGYQLVPQQQTDGTLRGISMYLLLQESKGHRRLIIFPTGQVTRKSPGQVHIEVKDGCDEELMWYQYNLHPRFDYIEAKQSRASRMHLAALHIATTSLLTDKLLGMTGEERAIILLRQCWGNRPLTKDECLVLDNIKQLAQGRSPTISILCHDIEINSQQLNFLYSAADNVNHCHMNTECFEGLAYLNNVKNSQVSSRCYLTPREESRVIGVHARKPMLPLRFVPSGNLTQGPTDEREIESFQMRLDKHKPKNMCETEPKLSGESFPLDINPSSKLERDMMNELKESWDIHVNTTLRHASNIILDAKALGQLRNDIALSRQKVEIYLLNALNSAPGEKFHWHDNAHEILRVVGLVPTTTAADLAKIVVDRTQIKHFNPMLTHKSCERLLESISYWLRLCVLEDKMARLISFSRLGFAEEVTRELDTTTVWDTSTHPYWLVFEVENGLQIRQEQYKVAQHLIDNPGDVIQLNMGLGKTRVILPMLALHFSFHNYNPEGMCVREKVTRLHFLSALFEEALKYLQDNLCASILGIKIYTMPFCRDFTLDAASVMTMNRSINDCRMDGGVLVVAPEHRLSLELKVIELYRSGENEIASRIENKIIKKNIWRDILDECDELLRHRYQLVYALGTAVALPGGANRWRAIQAIFAALAQNEELKRYLSLNPKACKVGERKSTAEWPKIQFFDGESLSDMLGENSDCRPPFVQDGLLSRLADTILSSPPYELEWVLDHPLKDDIKKMIIKKEYLPHLQTLPEHHLSDILALRGFLAGGVLCHCLLKRHRVDFGVARPGKKRLAIPFRFADTPDLRSEFSHPDCAIAFTVLAYYQDGLTQLELMQTLKSLMTLGQNGQHNFYNNWFIASLDQMKDEDPGCVESLNCIKKIDVTNETQMEKMWQFYRHNIFTINFFLNNCVFPDEMHQFDSRLTVTSWNLAQNPSNDIVGFSGTNDNHRILPLQVRQYFSSHEKDPDWILKNLDGTNGKMLETIVTNTVGVRQLEANASTSSSLINLLSEGIKGTMQRVDAIIDCGALLAGIDLQKISQRILNILPIGEFGGVLFYDATMRDWVILERSGRLLPKDVSPIGEEEAFIIFDEPRCRGTDLKPRPTAIALLTLAPKLCKDKLMQAAGRLRKLGRSQKLIIIGGANVFSKIDDLRGHKDNSITISTQFQATAIEILSWAMKNTCESTACGLPNWSNQGLFFASVFDKDPQFYITEEILKLDDMYGKSFTEQTVVEITSNAYLYHMNRTGGKEALHTSIEKMVDSIHKQVEKFGCDFTFSKSGCDGECERKLELEVEEEEEVEVEVPLMDPVEEKTWDFNAALRCQSPSKLPIGVELLSSFFEKFTNPDHLAQIKWSKAIYCTDNFAQTVTARTKSSICALNYFLRVVNFVLCFPSGTFLLLSEFEANAFVDIFWKNSVGSHHLVQSSFLRISLDGVNEILLQCKLQKRSTTWNSLFGERLKAKDIISNKAMASLQLFAGESTFATGERKEALKSLLRVGKTEEGVVFCPRTEAERLVEMRGLGKFHPYSDLEALCEQLLCEL